MLARIVELSIRLRAFILGLLLLLFAGGAYAAIRLPIDAIPDISPVQVSVLTEAPGFSSAEVERAVTFPLENALNGVPGMVELRSVSRGDISAITIIFEDGMDPWFVRQVVLERTLLAQDMLPAGVGKPTLSPMSNGLGEIYQFVLRGKAHTERQLRSLLDWEVIPRLRSVPGVIEVNAFGGQLKQYQVVADPASLRSYGLTLEDLVTTLRTASATASGGYVDRGDESYTLRATGLFQSLADIEDVIVKVDVAGTPVLIKHVAEVRVGAALPQGVVTYQGEEKALTAIVMMLQGSNSRDVLMAVKAELEEIEADLPAGIVLEPVYDRSSFVERTLQTVMTNLVEGILIVTVVLTVLMGSLRGALVVVLGIPASMSIALFGMHLTNVTGDLMSLGAIDFGFLVDGPIVVLESLLAAALGRHLSLSERRAFYDETIRTVLRPVAFSVAIIMLVYIPLLGLEGVEGKMFRPMAITMAFALFGALVYTILFLPALLVLFVPPPMKDGAPWLARLEHRYAGGVANAIRVRWVLLLASAAALLASAIAFADSGANFVPRIDEGDAVVTIRRAPSINLEKARKLDLAAQLALREFPETVRTLAQTGRAELAIDPVGKESTDILVALAPKEDWVSAADLDGISELFKVAVENAAPGTFASVSQPIEDRTNELISGSRADVQVMVYGDSLEELMQISEQIASVVRDVEGTGDIRVERALGLPELVVRPDRAKMARHAVTMEAALHSIEAARVGVPVGSVFEGARRFELRLLVPPSAATPEALGDLYVEGAHGSVVPLAEVSDIREGDGPTQIRREDRQRTLRVEVNLRGRDLVSWVDEARKKVEDSVELPPGYEVVWGGQFENFERATKRLLIIVPLSLAIVFAMLVAMFGDMRYAIAVFSVVPFAMTGGFGGLLLRELPFSIPAAVGFVALAGVAVLNGVVLASQVRARVDEGMPIHDAIVHGSAHTMRAVLTTGSVAALGFLPMALASSAGAEVQRPLATVVVFGIGYSTLITMFLLPGILRTLLPRSAKDRDSDA